MHGKEEPMEERRVGIRDKWKKLMKVRLGKDKFMVMALVGLLLFVIALPTGTSKKEEEKEDIDGAQVRKETVNISQDTGEDSYVLVQEERLTKLLQEMDGVGKVKVMLTIAKSAKMLTLSEENTTENIVTEKDAQGGERNSSDYSSVTETVYGKDSSGNDVPYVVQTVEPVVGGVVVIAEGGGNDDIRKSITEVVQALFNIEAHKIKVVKMKS